jgi:hypothetical protein
VERMSTGCSTLLHTDRSMEARSLMPLNKDLSLSQGPYFLSISPTYRISYHLNELGILP